MSKKIGVLLSGSGVYDGSEIHESSFTLLSIAQHGGEAVCFAPDVDQHHVINHLNGEEMNEKRNVLVESARIARGAIASASSVNTSELDALVIPGGFGTAKNHTKWAFEGPDGTINSEVKRIIVEMAKANKPLVGLCMGPTTIAKALEGSEIHASLTVGSTAEASPYEIEAISQGMEKAGAKAEMKTIREILIDDKNNIITAPCYMMEATILEVHDNVQQAIKALFDRF
jgi:enhancing lycopene biosynthesis protein 2